LLLLVSGGEEGESSLDGPETEFIPLFDGGKGFGEVVGLGGVVEPGTVSGSEVLEEHDAIGEGEDGVMVGNAGVVEDDVVVWAAACLFWWGGREGGREGMV